MKYTGLTELPTLKCDAELLQSGCYVAPCSCGDPDGNHMKFTISDLVILEESGILTNGVSFQESSLQRLLKAHLICTKVLKNLCSTT